MSASFADSHDLKSPGCDERKLFCELASTRILTVSGFCNEHVHYIKSLTK